MMDYYKSNLLPAQYLDNTVVNDNRCQLRVLTGCIHKLNNYCINILVIACETFVPQLPDPNYLLYEFTPLIWWSFILCRAPDRGDYNEFSDVYAIGGINMLRSLF
jgi:hypothetical protein